METQKRSRLESHRSTSSTRHHHHHHLPQEIVEQIMIKLPTKSILRFKCVSKSWRSLASSDRFIKAHLEESSKDKSLDRHHIVFGSSRRGMNRLPLPSFLREHNIATAEGFNYPTCAPEDCALIVGSCNGLLCILKNNVGFILWNPTTQKFKNLLPPFGAGESRYVPCAFGFGFDECNDDYKVIGMWKSTKLKLLAKTYSSKTDSWREVDDPVLDPIFAFNAAFGITSGNKFRWEVYGRGDDTGLSIVYFALKDKAFGSAEPPGRFTLTTHAFDRIDYWVVDPRWRNDHFYSSFVGPGDGDILAQHNCSFVRFTKGLDGEVLMRSCASIYVESLVEP